MMPYIILKLQERLMMPLPGKPAQLKMAPSFRPQTINTLSQNQAGVMLLLFPENKSICTVFIKRAEYPGVHSGQISFPGGKLEPGDKTIANTALRETTEEIGVIEKDIKILGMLTPVYIPISNFEVSPFIGYINYTPEFIIDKSEVAYIIKTNVKLLLNPGLNKEEFQVHGTHEGIVPFFEIENHKIWGATAMILNEFIEIWNSIN